MKTSNNYLPVKTGSTVLLESGFAAIKGKRVGFVGNHTSRLSNGSSTLTEMFRSGTCTVERLFAPEHGAFGAYDADVEDEYDPASGLTIHSLYGAVKQPTAEMLDGVDTLVFELQDVGARFYTYTATLLQAIDAAHAKGCKVLVLDRPNPINGVQFDGPIAKQQSYSFVAPYSLPVRHGLTLGEVGLLYAHETSKQGAFDIIPMEGWSRSQFWDETRVPWVSPSPAMRSLSTAILYPGTCLLEQTNVSVGRGTDYPFEILGAPFINAEAWSDALSEEEIDGVVCVPASFTPNSSKYVGQLCNGLKLTVTNRTNVETLRLGIALASTLGRLYPDQFDMPAMAGLLANQDTMNLLASKHGSKNIAYSWSSDLEEWDSRRKSMLIYND